MLLISNETRIRKHVGLFDPGALISAVVIAGLSCVGTALSDSAQPVVGSLGIAAYYVFQFFLTLAVTYFFALSIFSYFDSNTKHSIETAAISFRAKHLLKYSGVCFCAWMIWIIAHWPGTMRDDSIPQFFQAMGYYPFYTQHPIFDTIWFGFFWKIGAMLGDLKLGLFLYVIVQAMLTSLVFAFILCCLRVFGVPRALINSLLIFYAISRAIYQPIDTMSKDAFNGYLFALVVILLVYYIKIESPSRRISVVYAISVFLCIASKRSMMYVIIPSSLCFIFYLFKHSQVKNAINLLIISLLPTFIFLFIWNPISIKMLNAESNATYEMFSIPEQQVTAAILKNPSVLSSVEYDELNEYMDSNAAISAYNPSRSDEVSGVVRTKPDKIALLKIWLKVLQRDPVTCLKSFFTMTGKWFSLSTPIDYGHDMEAELLNPERMKAWSSFFSGNEQLTEELLGGLRTEKISNQWLFKLTEFLDATQKSLAPICSYGLFAFAVPVAVLIYGISRKQIEVILLSIVPLLLLFSYLVGPIALYWYSIPSVYIAPIVLCFPLLFRNRNTARLDDAFVE